MRSMMWAGLCLAGVLLRAASCEAAVFTPGEHSVSDRGSAVYTVPLVTPPGAAGVEPKLALQYNSQSGNGHFGVTVSLNGLSSITRCPRTMAQDGARGGVNYDNNDRLCLDGQRLMLVAGSYGADGAEYRFEHDNFSRIIGKGVMSSNTAWFEVTQRDGSLKQYGASADSRIEAQGTSTIATWALYRTINTSQNYLEWRYTKTANNGEWYPASVYYTGKLANAAGGAMPTFAEVRFLTYNGDVNEGRPDSIPQYKAGSKTQLTKLIRRIQTYTDGVLVREYRLAYDQGPNSKRSRVTQITECAANGACLQPTTLEWAQSGTANLSLVQFATSGNTRALYIPSIYSSWDPEGIGRNSFLTTFGDGPGLHSLKLGSDALVASAGDDLWSNESTSFRWFDDWGGSRAFTVADVNGDGRADFWAADDLCLSTGVSMSCSRYLNYYFDDDSETVVPRLGAFIGDFNADGRHDFVHLSSGNSRNMSVWLGQGNGSFVKQDNAVGIAYTDLEYSGDPEWGMRTVMDINGDGYPDIVTIWRGNSGASYRIKGWLGSGNGFASEIFLGEIPADASQNLRIKRGDVNGDGLDDLVYISYDGTPFVMFSTGRGFLHGGSVMPPEWGAWNPKDHLLHMELVDVNRDGRDDIVVMSGENTVQVYLSTGVAFYKASQFDINQAGSNMLLGDFDGDGSADILAGREYRAQYDSEVSLFHRLTNNWPDVVRTVVDGTGQRIVFDYDYLSYLGASSLYVKDPIPAYPLLSQQYPMLVVKAVTQTNVAPSACWSIGPLSQCPSVVARTEPNPTTLSTRYRYGGLRAEQGTGRGSQGFRWIEATQEQTSVVTTTEYEQSFPLTGLTKTVTTRAAGVGNGGVLKLVSNTNSAVALPGGRYFTYLAQSTEDRWDLNGAAWPRKELINTYECSAAQCYGNLTQSVLSATDGYSETKRFTYRNDTSTNILGLPVRVEVTRAVP